MPNPPQHTVRLSFDVPVGVLRAEVRPVFVSQHNTLALLGMKPRSFLESLHAFRAGGGEVISRGRTRMVAIDGYLEFLREPENIAQQAEAARLAEAAGMNLVR